MLQDHVPSRIVLHGMISRLLGKSNLVLTHHLLDGKQFLFLILVLGL
jgi:hypothetical protein